MSAVSSWPLGPLVLFLLPFPQPTLCLWGTDPCGLHFPDCPASRLPQRLSLLEVLIDVREAGGRGIGPLPPLALILPAQRLKFPCVFIHSRHPLTLSAQTCLGSSYHGSSSPVPDVLRCWTLRTSPPFFVPRVEWLPAADHLWVPSLSHFSAFPSLM